MEHLDLINIWKKTADLSAYGRFSSLMDLFLILNSYKIDASDNEVTDTIVCCFNVDSIGDFYLRGKFKQYLLQDISGAFLLTVGNTKAKSVSKPVIEKEEEAYIINDIDPNQEILDMKPEDFKEMEFDSDYCKLLGEDNGR